MSKKQQQDPYLKACALLGIESKPELTDRSDKDALSIDAYARLIICIRAKNMVDGKVWEINHAGSQAHYYPWLYKNEKDPSGLGLSYYDYDYDSSLSYVGSRLEYRTRDLAREGAEEFKKYYADFMQL